MKGVTLKQKEVMRAIKYLGGRTTARELAQHLECSVSTAWVHVKRLQNKGVIRYPFTPKTYATH